MTAWNFQKTEGTCQFRVPWFGYPCGYSSLTIFFNFDILEVLMNRKKLTITEQISDMHQKGITFHYTEEQDVSCFLKYNNYYFKLKSYGKNYDKYNSTEKKGQYLNLDFSYLQELF